MKYVLLSLLAIILFTDCKNSNHFIKKRDLTLVDYQKIPNQSAPLSAEVPNDINTIKVDSILKIEINNQNDVSNLQQSLEVPPHFIVFDDSLVIQTDTTNQTYTKPHKKMSKKKSAIAFGVFAGAGIVTLIIVGGLSLFLIGGLLYIIVSAFIL